MSQRNAGNPSKYGPKLSKPAAAASSSSASSAAASGADFPTALVLKGALWCACWWAACKVEFGSIFLVLSAIAAIFHNLSSEGPSGSDSAKGAAAPKLSAYSVFNKDATRIAGSMDAEQIDNQIRHKATSVTRAHFHFRALLHAPHPLVWRLAHADAVADIAAPTRASFAAVVCLSSLPLLSLSLPHAVRPKASIWTWAIQATRRNITFENPRQPTNLACAAQARR